MQVCACTHITWWTWCTCGDERTASRNCSFWESDSGKAGWWQQAPLACLSSPIIPLSIQEALPHLVSMFGTPASTLCETGRLCQNSDCIIDQTKKKTHRFWVVICLQVNLFHGREQHLWRTRRGIIWTLSSVWFSLLTQSHPYSEKWRAVVLLQ